MLEVCNLIPLSFPLRFINVHTMSRHFKIIVDKGKYLIKIKVNFFLKIYWFLLQYKILIICTNNLMIIPNDSIQGMQCQRSPTCSFELCSPLCRLSMNFNRLSKDATILHSKLNTSQTSTLCGPTSHSHIQPLMYIW